MSGLVFSEESLINENLFKFEQRLKTHTMKYIENGALLTTYYNIKEDATTVDRGIQDIEQLFGHKSPLRFDKINNFPVYGFGQTNPANTDEIGIEDINVDGECIILPSTVVPHPNDFFIINHLKMRGIFQITDVQYDSMKAEGYYKVRYRLHSTSDETLTNLDKQCVETYHVDLDAIGSNVNPVIKEDNFIRRGQIQQMINSMIQSYRALFYNERHNCFLFHDQETNDYWFDMCGNQFMAKHSLINVNNSGKVIILHDKLRDKEFSYYYNNSIYNWIELGCPKRMLNKFHFVLADATGYPDSSFARWADQNVYVIQTLPTQKIGIYTKSYSFFDDVQLRAFDESIEPTSEFDKLIWKFINKSNSLTVEDISLYTADTLISSIKHIDVFLYTPIIVYMIRKILRMN